MKSKILIVDDEKDICDLVELNLVSNGFENVKSVFDGKTAIETAAAWLPDLILLDVMLPEIDGLGVCRILKENETTKDIPIILLTAKMVKNTPIRVRLLLLPYFRGIFLQH